MSFLDQLAASGVVDLGTMPTNVQKLTRNLRSAAGDPVALLADASGEGHGSSAVSAIRSIWGAPKRAASQAGGTIAGLLGRGYADPPAEEAAAAPTAQTTELLSRAPEPVASLADRTIETIKRRPVISALAATIAALGVRKLATR